MAKADGVFPELDKLEWWKNHQLELPNWSRACKTALLIQPSLAAAERVFSLLNNSFKLLLQKTTQKHPLWFNTIEESELHSMYNNCIADYTMAFLSNNSIKIAPNLENNKTKLENNKVYLTELQPLW